MIEGISSERFKTKAVTATTEMWQWYYKEPIRTQIRYFKRPEARENDSNQVPLMQHLHLIGWGGDTAWLEKSQRKTKPI